jgi:hypothetical protein
MDLQNDQTSENSAEHVKNVLKNKIRMYTANPDPSLTLKHCRVQVLSEPTICGPAERTHSQKTQFFSMPNEFLI